MKPATILVVDDEPFMRDMIVSLLRESESDYIVVGEAINGFLALEFLQDRPVDIVLTDIRMPVMDGLELIRESGKRALRIGFVVLSAYNEFHIVKDAFKLGAWDFLLKSEITRTDLLQVLDGVAARLEHERDIEKSSEEVGGAAATNSDRDDEAGWKSPRWDNSPDGHGGLAVQGIDHQSHRRETQGLSRSGSSPAAE